MRRLLTTIGAFCLCFILSAFTNLPPEKPKLIVSIIVDNLSPITIDQNKHLLSEDGLLKLFNEGTSYTNAYYPYATNNKACDYASFVTGAPPSQHGIVGDKWYNPKDDEYTDCTKSKKAVLIGNKTPQAANSPEQMVASTFSDELSLYTLGESKIYSISLDANPAVVLAGHSADGAFWMDDSTGNWVSSDYYLPWLPTWLTEYNKKKYPDFYTSQEWVLTHHSDNYHFVSNNEIPPSFPKIIAELQDDILPYKILKSTPMGNMLILDLAQQIIKEEKLGDDNVTDVLLLNFCDLTDSRFYSTPRSLEKVDHIVKLDKEIARLLSTLDKEIGQNNYLIQLASTKPESYTITELKQARIPCGIFEPTKAIALLNSYLMALHGQGKWILNHHNQQLYINNALIEKSNLNISEFNTQIAQFLEEFSGIKTAISTNQIKLLYNYQQYLDIANSQFIGRSGDIIYTLQPGWIERHKGSEMNWHTNSTVPMVLWGWKVERKQIDIPTPITSSVLELSQYLKTPKPNTSCNPRTK